jgi:hypothetical protein
MTKLKTHLYVPIVRLREVKFETTTLLTTVAIRTEYFSRQLPFWQLSSNIWPLHFKHVCCSTIESAAPLEVY